MTMHRSVPHAGVVEVPLTLTLEQRQQIGLGAPVMLKIVIETTRYPGTMSLGAEAFVTSPAVAEA